MEGARKKDLKSDCFIKISLGITKIQNFRYFEWITFSDNTQYIIYVGS